ncbi:MAG: glycoside hydrolase family 127 protein [Bryobacteraceae bacterium]
MRLFALTLTAFCISALPAASQQETRADIARDYPFKPVPFTAVHVNDEFWAPKIETNRKVTIPYAFDQCERTGRVENFVRAAEVLQGEDLKDKHPPGYPFDDTDIYKVIEGASYTLSVHPDPKLDAYVDSLIAKIAAAQEKDGYLYTTRTIDPQHPHPWAGTERWQNEEILSHELYNLGHLYEAAVAHYQATGKRTLLDVAIKSADLLTRTFGPGKRTIYPGHQIVEMGLVKLYRVTGNEQYLALAKFMLDSRGPNGSAYNQANLRVIDQTEAVGHAVRATYMYSGMADVAALTGDQAYINALDAIWENVVTKKLYITGGIGAVGAGEAFGASYELPNMTAYNETCASVGNDFWNERMFLLHGDAKYVDVLERTLYNGLISGVSLDGKSFFYPNPLESNGQHKRSPWFGVACCPGNITRFMASVPGYIYATRGDSLYVNLFIGSTAEIAMQGGYRINMVQHTNYPWDGAVKIDVNPQQARSFAIKVRIPGWASGEAVPGDLYRFVDQKSPAVSLKVNGKTQPVTIDKGYATLSREWKPGDTIALELPMPVQRIVANTHVAADRGRIAFQRGPLVYAFEWPDNDDGHVRNLLVEDRERISAEFKSDLLGGVEVIHTKAVSFSYEADGTIKQKDVEATAIPYYAWANRGAGQMEVWMADSESTVHPTPYPSLASKSTVMVSGDTVVPNGVKDPRMVARGEEPASSSDQNMYFDWWPRKGTTEWIQYTFPGEAAVSECEVYWFDDNRQVRVPASWRILYKDGSEWRPVENLQAYGSAKDTYNRVSFRPVKTDALRLELNLRSNYSAGIEVWQVK